MVSPYKDEFLTRWRLEFQELVKKQLLDLDGFSSSEASCIRKLLREKKQFDESPILSVIIPVYNSEKYLEKCLDSVINQTMTRLEIICVNDGSTDNSEEILNEYAACDNRITVLNKKNGGLSSARNVGLNNATCEYICFLDSDDYILPETYEQCINKIGDADILIFGTKVIGNYMEDCRSQDQQYYDVKYSGFVELDDHIRLNVDVSAWDKIYRRSKIDEIGLSFPEGLLYEDYYFYWRYIDVCDNAIFEKQQYHRYLRHPGTIMASTFNKNKRAVEHLIVLDRIFEIFSKDSDFSDHQERNNKMFNNCFWFAYGHSPDKYKRKILRMATDIINKYDLNGDNTINYLKRREYSSVDKNMLYTFRARSLRSSIRVVEKLASIDLSGLLSSLRNSHPPPDSKGKEYASTEWVNSHEIRSGIERWATVYDYGSTIKDVNWRNAGGLIGGKNYSIPESKRNVFSINTELKILVTIDDIVVTIMQGSILNSSRCIFGNSIRVDGGMYTVTIYIDVKNKLITGESYKDDGKNVSKALKILKIETRVY